MKILYLILLYNGEINGGHTYRMATATALKNIVGYENLDLVLSELDDSNWGCNVALRLKNYSSGKDKLKNLLSGNITQRSNHDIDLIIDLIHKKKYDLILLGSSETGKLLKKIKKYCNNIKTITWYHDIVADVISRKLKKEFDIRKLPIWMMERAAEKIDAQMTDIAIVLHQRDADLLYKYWKRKTDVFIPIILEDKFEGSQEEFIQASDEALKLLFVGAYNWSVNIEAVQWFCKKVMSKLYAYNIEFYIAGFEMEKLLLDEWIKEYKNVIVLGTVDNLADTYQSVDVVVEPILTGSGMKVKTAEALMHGKEIIGTAEALVGYEELTEYVCCSAEEFINRIIEYSKQKPKRFVSKNRKLYEDYYSIPALERKLSDVLKL